MKFSWLIKITFLSLLICACSRHASLPEKEFKIYLISQENNSQNGKKLECGDLLVPITKNTKDDEKLLECALTELIETKDTEELKNYVKGPQFMLFQVNTAGGIADAYFKGELEINSLCDINRISEQILGTISQFKEFKKVNIYINNQTLSKYLTVAAKGFK